MNLSAKHTILPLIIALLLSACSDKRIEYSGDTVASEDQRNIITGAIAVIFAKDFRCLSVSTINISEQPGLPDSKEITHEVWEASGCENTQSFSVDIYNKKNIINVDRISRLLPNNSFKPNALRYTNNMAEQRAMLLAPLRTSA